MAKKKASQGDSQRGSLRPLLDDPSALAHHSAGGATNDGEISQPEGGQVTSTSSLGDAHQPSPSLTNEGEAKTAAALADAALGGTTPSRRTPQQNAGAAAGGSDDYPQLNDSSGLIDADSEDDSTQADDEQESHSSGGVPGAQQILPTGDSAAVGEGFEGEDEDGFIPQIMDLLNCARQTGRTIDLSYCSGVLSVEESNVLCPLLEGQTPDLGCTMHVGLVPCAGRGTDAGDNSLCGRCCVVHGGTRGTGPVMPTMGDNSREGLKTVHCAPSKAYNKTLFWAFLKSEGNSSKRTTFAKKALVAAGYMRVVSRKAKWIASPKLTLLQEQSVMALVCMACKFWSDHNGKSAEDSAARARFINGLGRDAQGPRFLLEAMMQESALYLPSLPYNAIWQEEHPLANHRPAVITYMRNLVHGVDPVGTEAQLLMLVGKLPIEYAYLLVLAFVRRERRFLLDAHGELLVCATMREFASLLLTGAYMPLVQSEREAYYEALDLAYDGKWSPTELAGAHLEVWHDQAYTDVQGGNSLDVPDNYAPPKRKRGDACGYLEGSELRLSSCDPKVYASAMGFEYDETKVEDGRDGSHSDDEKLNESDFEYASGGQSGTSAESAFDYEDVASGVSGEDSDGENDAASDLDRELQRATKKKDKTRRAAHRSATLKRKKAERALKLREEENESLRSEIAELRSQQRRRNGRRKPGRRLRGTSTKRRAGRRARAPLPIAGGSGGSGGRAALGASNEALRSALKRQNSTYNKRPRDADGAGVRKETARHVDFDAELDEESDSAEEYLQDDAVGSTFQEVCRRADMRGPSGLSITSRQHRLNVSGDDSVEGRLRAMESWLDDQEAEQDGRPNGSGLLWEGKGSSGGYYNTGDDDVELETRGHALRTLCETGRVQEGTPSMKLPIDFVKELRNGKKIKIKKVVQELVIDVKTGENKSKSRKGRRFPFVNSDRGGQEDAQRWEEYCLQNIEEAGKKLDVVYQKFDDPVYEYEHERLRTVGRRAIKKKKHYTGMLNFMRTHWSVVCRPALDDAREHGNLALRLLKCRQVINYTNAVRRLFEVYRIALASRHQKLWEFCEFYPEKPDVPPKSDSQYYDDHGPKFWSEVSMDDNVKHVDLCQQLVVGPQLIGGRGVVAARNTRAKTTNAGRKKHKCDHCGGPHVAEACPAWLKTTAGQEYVKATRALRGGLSRKAWMKANPGKEVPVARRR